MHAEGVEPLGDAQLVGEGEVDAFALRAVAERGVVKGDVMEEDIFWTDLNGMFQINGIDKGTRSEFATRGTSTRFLNAEGCQRRRGRAMPRVS